MAKKLHPKQLRYSNSGKSRNRKKRLKSFTDEKHAEEYAKKLNLKKFKIVKANLGLGKKYKIVLE